MKPLKKTAFQLEPNNLFSKQESFRDQPWLCFVLALHLPISLQILLGGLHASRHSYRKEIQKCYEEGRPIYTESIVTKKTDGLYIKLMT